jgi:fructosamine-3-kinase
MEDKQLFVDTVLGVNSLSWHGEIERDDLTLCSAMMAELSMRKREMGMKMRTMWRIRADMRNQGYDLPNWVGKTMNRCNNTPDWDLYLLYRGS